MDERRRHQRRAAQLPAIVRIGGRDVRCRTADISPGGAFLELPVEPPQGDLVATIELPHGKKIHVRATVRWRNARGVGVSFDHFLESPSSLRNLGSFFSGNGGDAAA